MDLSKHGFWIAMGVGAVVAFALYFVWVGGKQTEIDRKERQLQQTVNQLRRFAEMPDDRVGDPAEGLPTGEAVAYWQRHREHLRDQRREVLRTLSRRAETLRRIDVGRDDPARFTANIRSTLNTLDGRFRPILDEDRSFSEVVPILGDRAPQSPEEIPFAQKRFYIGEAIAEAAMAAGVRELVSVAFDQPPPDLTQEQRQQVTAQRLGATFEVRMPVAGLVGDRDRRESRLRSLRRLELDDESPTGIPALVSAFLKHPRLLFEVASVRVTQTPFTHPELAPWRVFEDDSEGRIRERRSFGQDVYIATRDTTIPEAAEEPPPLREPDVRVTIRVNVLDLHIPEDMN